MDILAIEKLTSSALMKKLPILFALLLIISVGVSAQEQGHLPCRADDLSLIKPLSEFTEEELALIAEADMELTQFTAAYAAEQIEGARSSFVIPVVFHIIHNNGPENISDEQIYDAMRVLNEDFNKENSDWDNVQAPFLGLVADVDIEFRLAQKDPSGNCTKGITRTVSALTAVGDQDMKDLIQWPRNKYLNVWVSAEANGSAGYTYRPNAVSNWPQADGIVLKHNYTGSIGTSSVGRSRTLTHEVGHWLNLKHTWGGTNDPELTSNCNDDDDVSDTPNTVGWTSCTLSGTTCGSLDNVENYMDYSYCSKMFTNGQATRMLAALNSSTAQRNQLHAASNLTATGVEGTPVLCAAEFTSDLIQTCEGTTVQFEDISYHGVQTRTWTFPGGSPSTASIPAPVVIYNEPGTYTVTLTVSDGTNTLTTTIENLITVFANPGAPMPFDDGFEEYSDLGNSPWTVINENNNATFQLTNAIAHTGVNCVRLLNSASMDGQTDELLSETMDMSNESSVVISYRYAYAQRNSNNDDRLQVFVSNNCGETWSMRQQLRGSNTLNTGGVTNTSFVPVAGQWGYSELSNISSSYFTPDFRMKFVFESYGGNNLYIDDININGSPVGVEDVSGLVDDLAVMPNPATDMAQALFTMTEAGQVRLELLDVMGRTVRVLRDGTMGAGMHRVELPVAELGSGLYFVRVQRGTRSGSVRFVVN